LFGYVKPFVPDLKVKDNDLYKAFYCGLCRALGAHICRSSKFTLSYDIVFLAIVREAAANDGFVIRKKRCAVHPFKKRAYVADCPSLVYSARASSLLTYHKFADDVKDTKYPKKVLKKIFLGKAKKYRKKADLGELDREIEKYLVNLDGLENSGASPEMCADAFGNTLAAVFSHSFGDKNTERELSEFGYHIGRWIYFADAADDYESDVKKGEFNPFAQYSPFPCEEIETSMLLDLRTAEKALDLIEIHDRDLRDIIENIIYIGMPETAKKVLSHNASEHKDGDK